MYKLYEQHLLRLKSDHRYRILGRVSQVRSHNFLDFSTNDYLNLSRTPLGLDGQSNSQIYRAGATGSRLLSGDLELYRQFESIIATDKLSEAGLIFNSGFQANLSALSCLLDERVLGAKPMVFFDRLNHASLYQGVFLSKAELRRYHHNDMDHLRALLQEAQHNPSPKFIVTETVFGMDGDLIPLEEITALARQYNALLYLDEAHATGLFGVNGYGLSTTVKLQDIPHVIMGTFSKAIGSSGGYIACHQIIKDFLVNKATGFIYSTAPSPIAISAAFEAWKVIKSLSKARQALQEMGKTLRGMLVSQGLDIGSSRTHIIPIILRDERVCLHLQAKLLEEEILVSCVRPPTVPPKASRLRVALTSKHRLPDLVRLVDTLAKFI